MDRESALSMQLQQSEEKYKKEKLKWQQEKEEYQKLCDWYANSLRYQVGGLLIDCLHHPLHFFKLPCQMYHILKKYKSTKTEMSDIETVVSSIVEYTEKWKLIPVNGLEEELNEMKKKRITIVIPVFNACDKLVECIESIEKCTMVPYQIIVINDCSTEESVYDFLKSKQEDNYIRVIEHKENKGYVFSINEGIHSCDGDVVLLNSDTIVTKNWLFKLLVAAYSADDIMTVTPCSNSAGVFSVPKINQNNEFLNKFTIQEISELTERENAGFYMDVLTGNGFCMYIKRNAFRQIGYFDEELFGKGYCEENDFCVRLKKAGFRNVFCGDTYIYHSHSASFGKDKSKLFIENKKKLLEKYPEYDFLVEEMLSNPEFQKIGYRVELALKKNEELIKYNKRILYVIQAAGGGSVKTNEDLMQYMDKSDFEVFLLNSNCSTLNLYRFEEGVLKLLQTWRPSREWNINIPYDSEWKEIYFNILFQLHIDIVHVRHLYKHTFDIINVAKWMHLPIVFSFHDFYYICPTINLINAQGEYCNAECRDRNVKCRISEPCIQINQSTPVWVKNKWQKNVRKMISVVDMFITTSEYSKSLYLKVYPEIEDRFQIIEHGRDFIYKKEYMGSVPEREKPIRILIAGNIDYNKGAGYIKKLVKCDVKKRLEIHCIGNLEEELKPFVQYHGKYMREDFVDYVKKIKPSFVAVFSVWPETYCHILTEAFSCGIPCIVSDIGTLRERALKGGCVLVDLDNPNEACEKICKFAENEKEYFRLQAEVLNIKNRNVNEMGGDYLDVYNKLLFTEV